MWNDDLLLRGRLKIAFFISAAVEYALPLNEQGLKDEAEQQLCKAELLSGPKHLLFCYLGGNEYGKGRHEKANRLCGL
jgi:hypothetical protein